jgi:hypothetical protein
MLIAGGTTIVWNAAAGNLDQTPTPLSILSSPFAISRIPSISSFSALPPDLPWRSAYALILGHPRSITTLPTSASEITTAEAYEAVHLPSGGDRISPIGKMPHSGGNRFCLAAPLDVWIHDFLVYPPASRALACVRSIIISSHA